MPRATIPAKDSGLALDTALDLLARAGEGEELEPDKARPAPGTHGRKWAFAGGRTCVWQHSDSSPR